MPVPPPTNVSPIAAQTTTLTGTGPVEPSPRVHTLGAASLWVLGQVAGPPRTATVLHAGRDAVYLDLAGSCLAVLAAGAVQVPCGVRTVLPALPEVRPGAEAVVADGSIELPGCEVMVTDIIDATVPVISASDAEWGAGHLSARVGPRLLSTRSALPASAVTRLAGGDPGSVGALLGLGPGLTPLGDDVLSGWLATAVAGRHPALDDVRSRVALEAVRRTTTLSATLLGCASRGEGVPELRALLSGVVRRDEAAVDAAADLLLAIGDTSGAGLVLGTLLAMEGLR